MPHPVKGARLSGELAFVEFGVEDVEKGRVFYSGLFGWRFEPGPSGQGFVISLPNVGAGMHGKDQGAAPYLFFRVDDIDAAVERVQELGGSVDDVDVDGDEESIARFGRFKLCRDDQGSPFGIHQPPLPM
jgi:predicted enzyme related to lactoylglutathione lyase